MLELKRLTLNDGMDIYNMLQEIPKEENGLMNGAKGLSFSEFKKWLAKQYQLSVQEGVKDGWKVPSTTFWLFADGTPVGFGKVRHCLTDALRREGGNIGCAIAPRFRGKGYGNAILRLLLEQANEIGVQKALVTIRTDNVPSQAAALANGGVITDKTDERLYIWIDTDEARRSRSSFPEA